MKHLANIPSFKYGHLWSTKWSGFYEIRDWTCDGKCQPGKYISHASLYNTMGPRPARPHRVCVIARLSPCYSSRKSTHFPQEIAFQNAVCKMLTIWSQPQYVEGNTARMQRIVYMCVCVCVCPKLILNSNLAKSRSSITSVTIVKSVSNFAQSTAVILPCSVQNVKAIGQLNHESLANEISRDLSLRWISDGYPILHKVNLPGAASALGEL